MEDQKLKRMSDVQPKPLECDEKVDMKALVDLDIVVTNAVEMSGQFGDFIFVTCHEPKQDRVLGFSTGGKVIVRKILNARDKGYLPLLAKIVKNDRYYDII